MGWETRERGGLYYTESHRVNGRVVREYYGCGPVARFCEFARKERHEEREWARWEWREERNEATRVVEALQVLSKVAKCAVTETLLGDGFHKHKGQWRRRRSAMVDPQEIERHRDEVIQILDDAQHGREGSREALRELMGERHMAEVLTKAFGDAVRTAEELLLSQAARGDVLCEETARAALADLQAQLSEPNDGELEKMLIRRSALCWLAVNVAERERAKRWESQISLEVADFWDRHVSRLNADYLRACRELANVRRLRRPRRQQTA